MAVLQGAEIFSVGKWNGMEFTDADLDAMVASFDALSLGGRVPLKLGHNDEQPISDGQPAFGWVTRVWRQGGKLFADFANVPRQLYDAIKNELYKFVSVELLQDAERNGDTFPWVLSAVALLGADAPAVSNLKDLSSLAMSRRSGLRCRAALAFTRSFQSNTGETHNMADETAALQSELAALKAQVAHFSEKEKALVAERDKVIQDSKREKADGIAASVKARFESAVEAKRILPSARERYFKWTFPKDVDAILAFDVADVERFIEENKVTETTTLSTRQKAPAPTEDGKSPDEVVSLRTRIKMSENEGMDYKAAMVEVLHDDPSLADEYRHLPETRAKK